MFDKIQARWEKELLYKQYPGAGKSTCVTFILKSSGEVSEVKSVKNDAGRIGEEAAVDAIIYSAPYPIWSAGMRAVLGGDQELTLTFYYQ